MRFAFTRPEKPHSHAHFQCTQCGRTICLDDVAAPGAGGAGGVELQGIELAAFGRAPLSQRREPGGGGRESAAIIRRRPVRLRLTDQTLDRSTDKVPEEFYGYYEQGENCACSKAARPRRLAGKTTKPAATAGSGNQTGAGADDEQSEEIRRIDRGGNPRTAGIGIHEQGAARFFREKLVELRDNILHNATDTGEHLRDTEVATDPSDRATQEEEYTLSCAPGMTASASCSRRSTNRCAWLTMAALAGAKRPASRSASPA